jgi:RNA polymerase primary sigma factor
MTEPEQATTQAADGSQASAVHELLEAGARAGKLSYAHINRVLGDAQIDDEDVEAIFEVLESRGIQVVDEAELAPKPEVSSAPKTPKTPKSARPDRELDDVLSKIETFFAPAESSTRSEDESGAEMQLAPEESVLSETQLSGTAAAILDDDADESGSAVSDAFTQYLQQMGRTPLMSPEEEQHLAQLAREASPEQRVAAKQRLVEANLRMVVHIARNYQGRGLLPLLDIVQEGNLGLIRAVEKFNPNKGQRLSSFATWYIRESINHALAAQARSIRLPGHLSGALQKLQRTSREMTQTLGREPSRQELAQAAGLSLKQVEELQRVVAEPLSLDQSSGGSENEDELGERVSDVGADDSMTGMSRDQLQEGIREVLETLPERESDILQQRFGLGAYAEAGPSSLDDIAANLRISRDRVHQLEVRALRKLRHRTKGTPLGALLSGDDEDDD